MDHGLGDVAAAAALLHPVAGPLHPLLELLVLPCLAGGAVERRHGAGGALGHEVDLVAVHGGRAGG